MQATIRRRHTLAGSAEELDAHWTELARFMTSRRFRGSIYSGAMGELSPAQLQAIGVLTERGLRMSELAAKLGLAESTVTRVVDRLQRARLVTRRASDPDRRCVIAELTSAGRRLAGELERSRRQFLSEFLATLRPEERSELIRLFAKVTDALRDRQPAGAGS
jgi:DNA-binding MarR family transcriptional regulator